jgi:hypothetical protein
MKWQSCFGQRLKGPQLRSYPYFLLAFQPYANLLSSLRLPQLI